MKPSLASALLRSWRDEQGITQPELAKLVECDFVELSKYERGAKRPGLKRALDIERVTKGRVPCGAWFMPGPPVQAVNGEG